MIDNLVTAAGLACFLFGLFVFFSAVLGLFRFDYVLNRMHAAAVGDSLGIFCVLIGLMLLHGWSLSAAKTLLIFVFLWLTSPVCSHLVAEMEVSTVPDLEKEYILLVGVIVCAIAAPLCKRLLASVIVYMALSLMMAVLWSLLQSPDLAITEAAVGAGVTSILFFLTLKKIHALKGTRDE